MRDAVFPLGTAMAWGQANGAAPIHNMLLRNAVT